MLGRAESTGARDPHATAKQAGERNDDPRETAQGRDEERHTVAAPNPVQVSCDGCLLAATAGRAFVAVDGAESDDQVRQLVSWAVPAESKPNYFANAGPALLDVTPANPDRMPLPVPYDRDRWLAFTHERTPEPFVKLRFAGIPPNSAQPGDYRPRWPDANPPAALDECGAPLDRLPAATVADPIAPHSD